MTKNKQQMRATTLSLFVLCSLGFPAIAGADIVVFKNGRSMSVKVCTVDAEIATMKLREGGEVTFPATMIARVDPDEVPYPEPADTVAPPENAAIPVAQAKPVLIADEVLAARPF